MFAFLVSHLTQFPFLQLFMKETAVLSWNNMLFGERFVGRWHQMQISPDLTSPYWEEFTFQLVFLSDTSYIACNSVSMKGTEFLGQGEKWNAP